MSSIWDFIRNPGKEGYAIALKFIELGGTLLPFMYAYSRNSRLTSSTETKTAAASLKNPASPQTTNPCSYSEEGG